MRLSIAKWYPAHSSNQTVGRGGKGVSQITIHHTAANNTTLRHLWADPARDGSSHFFVSGTAIEQYVDTDNTAWTNGWFPSNQESITIEVNGDWRFGYHNQAALNNLQKLLVAIRRHYPHVKLTYHMDERKRNPDGKTTLCPADLKHKGYAKQVWDKATAVLNPPVPPAPKITYREVAKKVQLIRDANLWNFNFTDWSKAKSIGGYPAGHTIDIVAEATNTLGGKYYMTDYSYNDGAIRATNGFNVKDTKDYVAPKPIPLPPKEPTPPSTEPPIIPPPDTPPVPPSEPDRNAIIAFLTMLRDLITEFLSKFKT